MRVVAKCGQCLGHGSHIRPFTPEMLVEPADSWQVGLLYRDDLHEPPVHLAFWSAATSERPTSAVYLAALAWMRLSGGQRPLGCVVCLETRERAVHPKADGD
jgi:hypothetical protein